MSCSLCCCYPDIQKYIFFIRIAISISKTARKMPLPEQQVKCTILWLNRGSGYIWMCMRRTFQKAPPGLRYCRIGYRVTDLRGCSHIMSATNGGLQTPPPALISQNQKLAYPTLSEKSENGQPPLPLVRNHIL